MKRLIVFVLCLVTLLFVTVSCKNSSHTQENGGNSLPRRVDDCDLCGERKNCSPITYKGETGWFCDDCYDAVEEMLDYSQNTAIRAYSKADCDLCGKSSVPCSKITVDGESGWFCVDCYDTAKSIAKAAEAMNR